MSEHLPPTAVVAIIHPAEGIPGLFDVSLSDGRELRDITQGQLAAMISSEQWLIQLASPGRPNLPHR